jgi:hypothetical protein
MGTSPSAWRTRDERAATAADETDAAVSTAWVAAPV